MLPPGLKTPRQVEAYYDTVYFSQTNSTHGVPFIYPWAGVGALVVIIYLLIDHRRNEILKACRWLVFAFLCAYQGWCIATNRARNPAVSFGVGLLSSWGVLLVAAIMIANDCQSDFKRVERTSQTRNGGLSKVADVDSTNGQPYAPSANGDVRQRRNEISVKDQPESNQVPTSSRFSWQSYPASPFMARVDWVVDVFCNFRGVGWTFQISGVPSLPQSISASLEGKDDGVAEDPEIVISRTGIRQYRDRATLAWHTFQSLAIGYVAQDVTKVLMSLDPYHMGYVNDISGPSYLPNSVRDSHILLKCYRLLLSLAGMYAALAMIFKLGPMVFCGLLGPRWLGLRGEAWMNPADVFGSFSNVLDHGLAGWWGGWWHQTFRFSFEAPAARLLEMLKIEKKSIPGKSISLFVAFFLSGFIHASGSYTQLGDTRPLLGPMRFFLLQPVGILAQTTAISWLERAGVWERLPKVVKQVGNVIVVHIWLYYTAPLLLDDFARGGIWLYEPVAVSPLRGLGFGPEDDGWFCWDRLLSWRTGNYWWDTGIAL